MTVVYPTNTALGRFGIANLVDSPDPFVSSMPLAGLVNPATGAAAVGPLAVLVTMRRAWSTIIGGPTPSGRCPVSCPSS